ncbi:hypothetical protein D3C86_1570350 [compost metagenome]
MLVVLGNANAITHEVCVAKRMLKLVLFSKVRGKAVVYENLLVIRKHTHLSKSLTSAFRVYDEQGPEVVGNGVKPMFLCPHLHVSFICM